MTKNCCVPQCLNNVKKRSAKHFHQFPKDKDLKKMWIQKLKLGRKPSKYMVVCSEHFKNDDYKLSNYGDKTILKSGSIPFVNIPKTSLYESSFVKTTRKTLTRTSLRAAEAAVTVCTNELASMSVCGDASMSFVSTDDEQRGNDDGLSNNNEPFDSDKFVSDVCAAFDLNSQVATKTTADASVNTTHEVANIATQTRWTGIRCGYSQCSDKDIFYFTGLERERFEILFKMVDKFDPIEEHLMWLKHDALLITLHKCRHNLDFHMMQFIFEIDRRRISLIFKEVIHKLYRVLKQIDIWNMSYKDPKSYRSLLDCTEFYVVRAGDPNVHQLTFSNYKHHPTFKLLVSCDEKGAVNFISDAYVGAISDREIVVKSGFLDKCSKGDSILADRGFDISDLLEAKGVLINIPPFLRGKEQLTNFEVMKTRIIANKRILIEQINCRAKKNKILVTPLQRTMWPYADKAIFVCFALVNFYNPIVQQ